MDLTPYTFCLDIWCANQRCKRSSDRRERATKSGMESRQRDIAATSKQENTDIEDWEMILAVFEKTILALRHWDTVVGHVDPIFNAS